MYKVIGMAVLWSLTIIHGYGQAKEAEGIRFEQGSWEEATTKARTEGKPLFIDIWASWCGPCKRLAREVFPMREVGEYFNENFVCYSLQIDPADSVARRTATTVADRYRVKALPTLLWLDGEGRLLHSSVGYVSGTELLAAAQKATDTEHNTAAVLRRWQQGERSLATGLVYFDVYRDSLERFDEFYLNLPKEDKLNTDLRYKMMFGLRLDARSRALRYIAAN